MQIELYDHDAPKKPTNVSINIDLLKKAKALKVNLSQTLEMRLEEIVRVAQKEKWLKENEEAIEEYNKRIEKRGLLSDYYRRF